MSEIKSFFSDAGQVKRERGMPMLIPAGMSGDQYRTRYTRASSLSNYVTDLTHLEKWERRYIAKGLGMRPDLAMQAASNPYNTGVLHKIADPEQERRNRASGRELDGIIDQALEFAGIHESANYGTAFHEFTEPGNRWAVPDVGHLPEIVHAYLSKLKELGILTLSTEVFTANDDLMSAGTFDHLMWVPGYGILVTDKKTGAATPEEWEVQLSTYSHSDVYDSSDDSRIAIKDYAEARFPGETFNPDVGIVFRTYWDRRKNVPAVEVYELDLAGGYERAKIAAQVRDMRAREKTRAERKIEYGLIDTRERLARKITETPVEGLTNLWNTWQHVWTDEHTELARSRKAEAPTEADTGRTNT